MWERITVYKVKSSSLANWGKEGGVERASQRGEVGDQSVQGRRKR